MEARGSEGNQVKPAAVTNYPHDTHEKARFDPIELRRFEVGSTFDRIVEEVTRKEKISREGRDTPRDVSRCPSQMPGYVKLQVENNWQA